MFNILIYIAVEAIVYMNYHAKASLFLRVQVANMQEEQMQNLINTMPDMVLICSKPFEDSLPKSVYSNRKMNAFFGCNLVLNETSKTKKRPAKKKIFKPYKARRFEDGGDRYSEVNFEEESEY